MISAFIRKLRGYKTQSQLARELGVKQYDISDWECGARIPNGENLVKLRENVDFSLRKGIDEALEETERKRAVDIFLRRFRKALAEDIDAV